MVFVHDSHSVGLLLLLVVSMVLVVDYGNVLVEGFTFSVGSILHV